MKNIRASTWALLVVCILLFGTVVKISFELDKRREMELHALRELQWYRLEELLRQVEAFQEEPDLLNAKRLANVWNNFASTTNAFIYLNQLSITPIAWESFQTSLQNNATYRLSSHLDVLRLGITMRLSP